MKMSTTLQHGGRQLQGATNDPQQIAAVMEDNNAVLEGAYRNTRNDVNWAAQQRRDAIERKSVPGFLHLKSADGTDYYLFVEDDGTVKIHTAIPTQNSDGDVVGAQT